MPEATIAWVDAGSVGGLPGVGDPRSGPLADLIEGLAKGLAALESFDTERQRLNETLAASRAGLSRAAA